MTRARVTWRKEPGSSAAAIHYGTLPGEPATKEAATSRFGDAPTDPLLTEDECGGVDYPAGTDWTTFTDDQLERYVEHLFEHVGSCEREMYWGQVGGGGWFGAYHFALARLQAIGAHRGAEWFDPIATRLSAYWDNVIEQSKRGLEAWQLAQDRATALFPNNPEAREAFVEVVEQEWRRVNYGEEPQETQDSSEA